MSAAQRQFDLFHLLLDALVAAGPWDSLPQELARRSVEASFPRLPRILLPRAVQLEGHLGVLSGGVAWVLDRENMTLLMSPISVAVRRDSPTRTDTAFVLTCSRLCRSTTTVPICPGELAIRSQIDS